MSNKSVGNKFEQEFAEMLSADGYWVYIMPTKQGQPADIVAGKDGRISLYDCKDCTGDRFVLSRIESNQSDSARLFRECGCYDYYFAIRLGGSIYLVSEENLARAVRRGEKTLNAGELWSLSDGMW